MCCSRRAAESPTGSGAQGSLRWIRAAVVTISTTVARGDGENRSGPLLAARCRDAELEVVEEVVSDDRGAIEALLARLCDEGDFRFVFTTGGTGLTQDDVTPEATRAVIERDAPGYAEAIRAESRTHTPFALLMRGEAGVRGRTLIVNLPGSPRAIEQCWPVLRPTVAHAAAMLERD